MIDLIQTCGACPEQYNAVKDGHQVGYLRLRHGYFAVRCPDYDGEVVYEAYPEGDGIFEATERDRHLNNAISFIEYWCDRQEKIVP